MTDVFISYARNDRERVRLIALALTAEGFAVWWDPAIKPGRKWNDAIRKALDNSAAVVTCWSPASARSDWVAAESNHANARKAFVPVMIRDCTPPVPFNMIQAADLVRWRGDPDDPEWTTFLREVRRLVEAKRRGVVAAPPPGEAEGATRAASSRGVLGGMEDVSTYRISQTRGRMGPRISQLVLGTVVIGAVLTAGLYGAERFYRAPPPPAELPPEVLDVTPINPPPPLQPDMSPTPISDVALDEPEVPEAPDVFGPTRQPTPRPTPRPPPAPAPTPVSEPTADIPGLEACAGRLAMSCPGADGRTPIGFRANRRIDGAERRFLIALGAASETRIDPSANATCEAQSPRRLSPPLRAACTEISFPPAPPREEPPPADKPPPRDPAPSNNDIGVFLGQVLTSILTQPPRNNDGGGRRDDGPRSQPPSPPTPPAQQPPVAGATTGTVEQTPAQSPGVILRQKARVNDAVRVTDPCASVEAQQYNPQCGGVR